MAEPATAAPPSRGPRRVVLNIDDDAVFRRFVELALTPELELLQAPDATSGLALLEDAVPDLVLLDIELQDLSGHEVLRRIRADPRLRKLPVLMLTSHSSADHAARAFADGAHGVVAKPVDAQELRRRTLVALRLPH